MAGPPWLDPHDDDTPRSRPVELRAYPWPQRPTVRGPNLIPTVSAIEAGPTAASSSEADATQVSLRLQVRCSYRSASGGQATPTPGSGSHPRRCYRTRGLISSSRVSMRGLSPMTRVRQAAGRLRFSEVLLTVIARSKTCPAPAGRGRHTAEIPVIEARPYGAQGYWARRFGNQREDSRGDWRTLVAHVLAGTVK